MCHRIIGLQPCGTNYWFGLLGVNSLTDFRYIFFFLGFSALLAISQFTILLFKLFFYVGVGIFFLAHLKFSTSKTHCTVFLNETITNSINALKAPDHKKKKSEKLSSMSWCLFWNKRQCTIICCWYFYSLLNTSHVVSIIRIANGRPKEKVWVAIFYESILLTSIWHFQYMEKLLNTIL